MESSPRPLKPGRVLVVGAGVVLASAVSLVLFRNQQGGVGTNRTSERKANTSTAQSHSGHEAGPDDRASSKLSKGQVIVHVRSETGHPIVGAQVQLHTSYGTPGSRVPKEAFGRTDSNGDAILTIEWPGPSITVRACKVSASGYPVAYFPWSFGGEGLLTPGRTIEHTVTVKSAHGTLAGVVRGLRGNEQTEVVISWQTSSGSAGSHSFYAGEIKGIRPTGEFAFERVPSDGVLTLRVSHPKYFSEVRKLEPSDPERQFVVVDLERSLQSRGAQITVRLGIDQLAEVGVQAVPITAQANRPQRTRVPAGGCGDLYLNPGRWSVFALDADSQGRAYFASCQVEVPDMEDPPNQEVTLNPEPAGTIVFEVLDIVTGSSIERINPDPSDRDRAIFGGDALVEYIASSTDPPELAASLTREGKDRIVLVVPPGQRSFRVRANGYLDEFITLEVQPHVRLIKSVKMRRH